MDDWVDQDRVRAALARIEELLQAAVAGADARAAEIARVAPDRRRSACNLAHYLAVRMHDLRPLQRELAALSLSSLGRMEGNVIDTLRGVSRLMRALLGERSELPLFEEVSLAEGERRLEENSSALLGPSPATRRTRIMITLPIAAATDRQLLSDLMRVGTDLVRVNLAHDGPAEWTAMVENVRAAAGECRKSCRIVADLPGPKLRTGPLEEGPCVIRIRPERDALGIVTKKAQVLFCGPEEPDESRSRNEVAVALERSFGALARLGDEIVATDARGRTRRFAVKAIEAGACRATIDRTAYLSTGGNVELRRRGTCVARTQIGRLPPKPQYLPLQVGDSLLVTRAQTPGRPAAIDEDSGELLPARIPCTLPEVFDAVQPGHRILFDDGVVAGEILEHDDEVVRVRITRTPPGGGKLRAEKGINLPDTDLHASALTDADLANLDWVAEHADLVGMSFVQRAADVARLHRELEQRGRSDLGIVLKIETAKAFDRFGELLFAGLHSRPFGVMVARGDLAAEVGYSRLAEVQEEILWLCEAAHVPVIWATQVLDSMAHTGMPSRAEVTDAGMGVRAECVMLNKGPHIVVTAQFLGSVLERMQAHHFKKRDMLRRLRVADEFGSG